MTQKPERDLHTGHGLGFAGGGVFTIFAPLRRMSEAATRVWTTARIRPSRTTA